MARREADGPMHIKLSQERRDALVADIQRFFGEEFDRELSEFQGVRLVDFLLRRLGAPIYNQAIQDARAAVQGKLDDLEGEFYEPESP